MAENRGGAFAAIAREWEPKTISVYAAAPGADRYSLADAVFPVEDGEVVLPDVLGRQLELRRVGRHERLRAFTVSDAGELGFEFWPGAIERERVAALEAGDISPRLQLLIDEALALGAPVDPSDAELPPSTPAAGAAAAAAGETAGAGEGAAAADAGAPQGEPQSAPEPAGKPASKPRGGKR
jgi:hypothetical protein